MFVGSVLRVVEKRHRNLFQRVGLKISSSYYRWVFSDGTWREDVVKKTQVEKYY